MSVGERLYTELLNNLTTYLTSLDPQLIIQSFNSSKGLLDQNNVKYEVSGSRIVINNSGSDWRRLSNFYTQLLEPFEAKYGMGKICGDLLKFNLKFFIGHRRDIHDQGVEVPIAHFSFTYDLFDKIHGLSMREISGHRWSGKPLFLTNQRIYLVCRGRGKETAFRSEAWRWLKVSDPDYIEREIPLQDVVLVGREIYVGREPWMRGAKVATIDFMDGIRMLHVVVLGSGVFFSEFVRIVSLMRRELKVLSDVEGRVLVVLTENRSLDDFRSSSGLEAGEVDAAVARLKQLKYISDNLKPTSYGINAAADIKVRI
jgi:hypothetical protein